MLNSEDLEELSERHLCWRCVDEPVLRDEVINQGQKAECFYCSEVEEALTIGALADRIEEVFNEHYYITAEHPEGIELTMLHDKESSYEWYRSGEETVYAIMNAAQIPEEAAHDIQSFLDDRHSSYDAAEYGYETPFSAECHYEERSPSDARWQSAWATFERSLKTEARFMSRSAADHLEKVFKDIHSLATWDGRPFVIEVGPGKEMTKLHRARVFQADDPLTEALARPDLHLGPPPSKFAAAGRMNAKGISVFYGANDPEAALAEVRPPVGSRVAVAEFDIIRPLKLLNLESMKETAAVGGSIFDPTLSERMGRAKFLRALSQHITQPVMPDDQDMEYLATQAIADFLATEYDPPLDGIAFKSVQAGDGKMNVVLFHKASLVEELPIKKGTKFDARSGMFYEDGWETDYVVIEEYPPDDEAEKEKDEHAWVWRDPDTIDQREASLRVNRGSIRVHHVEGVEVKTSQHSVHHHRWEDKDPGF